MPKLLGGLAHPQTLELAGQHLAAVRDGLNRNYTCDADVSWTQPPELMPYVYFNEDDPELGGLDRWSTVPGAGAGSLRPHRELRWMEWVVPKLIMYPIDPRTDVSKERGAFPRPPRFYIEPRTVVAAAANGGGGHGGDWDVEMGRI